MAYDTKELHERCMKAIKDQGLFFIKDIPPMVGIAESTWWEHFPRESEERKKQDEALAQNRVTLKVSMRSRWYQNNNATIQLALYKLIADDDERRRLAQQYIDHTTEGEQINPIDWSKVDDETIAKLYDALTSTDRDAQ